MQWGMVSRVLDKTGGGGVRARKIMYKAVVLTVLLYGRNSWVITWAMMKLLEAFHNWIARRLTGKTE